MGIIIAFVLVSVAVGFFGFVALWVLGAMCKALLKAVPQAEAKQPIG